LTFGTTQRVAAPLVKAADLPARVATSAIATPAATAIRFRLCGATAAEAAIANGRGVSRSSGCWAIFPRWQV